MNLGHRESHRPPRWISRPFFRRNWKEAAESTSLAPHEQISFSVHGVLGLVHQRIHKAVGIWALSFTPERNTWVVFISLEGAGGIVNFCKVHAGCGVDADLVVVLKVLADTGEVDDDGDVVLLEFGS